MGFRKTLYKLEIMTLNSKIEYYRSLSKLKRKVKSLLTEGNVSFDIVVIRHHSSKGIKNKSQKHLWEFFKQSSQVRAYDHITNTVYRYNNQQKEYLWYEKQFNFMLK